MGEIPQFDTTPDPLESGEKNREQTEEEKHALETARFACSNYHSKLDKTDYFDSKAINTASDLLPTFERINQSVLPEAVKLVIQHRLAYLKVFASFKKNPQIGKFLDTVKDRFGDQGLLMKKPADIYNMLKNNKEFQDLSMLDFRLVLTSTQTGIKMLKMVNGANNKKWDKEAEKLLSSGSGTTSRIDDLTAASNLAKGYKKLQEVVEYAQKKEME